MTSDYQKHIDIANGLLDTADSLGGVSSTETALAAAQVHATLAVAAAIRKGKRAAQADSEKVPAYRHHLEVSIDGGWASMPMLGSAGARVQVGTLSGRHDEGVFLTAYRPTENLEVQISFKEAAKLAEQIQQLSRFHQLRAGESK